jgi:hypothetical protein
MFPDVIVSRWHGIRGSNRIAQMRRDICAKYAIDLHDDSPLSEYVLKKCEKYPELRPLGLLERFYVIAHLERDYKDARDFMRKFSESWNAVHGEGECVAEPCDYPYCDHSAEQVNVLSLEFRTILPIKKLSVDEGVSFLYELIKYLQSEG